MSSLFLYWGVVVDPPVHTYEYFRRDDVCRFCWKNETLIPHHDLFNADMMGKIIECIDLDLSRYDRPKKVCNECKDLIDNFYKFKKLCHEAEEKMCEILSNNHESAPDNTETVKIEKEHVDSNDAYCDFDIFERSGGKTEVLRGKRAKNTETVKVEKEHVDSNDADCDFDIFERSGGKTKVLRGKRAKLKPKSTYISKSKRTATYCNICRLDLENVENFDSHNSEFHGIEKTGQYKCFGCEKLFKNRKTRLGHELNFCKGLKDGYKCDACGRFLPRRGMYEAHMRDHRTNGDVNLPEELFKCVKCDLLFKTKKLLDEHVVGHKSDTKKYVCESCGRVFSRVDYLLKHKLTHTGEKQHACQHCGFRTNQRSSLTMHIRRHTGERPYRCNVCPQRCISSSNLRAHQQRHLGIKMHECKICNKKFGYKVSLQEHMSTHAPAQTHACDQCTASYSRLRALKRHVATKHIEKMTGE